MYIQKDTVSNTHNFASHGSCNFPHTLYGMANVRAKRKRLNLLFDPERRKTSTLMGILQETKAKRQALSGQIKNNFQRN